MGHWTTRANTGYVVEPGPLTALESAWSEAPRNTRLTRKRQITYDPDTLLFFKPIRYTTAQVPDEPFVPPSEGWVTQAFNNLVVGDPKHHQSRGDPPPEFVCPPPDRRAYAPDTVVQAYLENCERELVYDVTIDALLREPLLPREDKIAHLLCNEPWGNRSNNVADVRTVISAAMDTCVPGQLPLQFVLPAFPFKDQTPFRTCAPARHIDFGEIALLVRLHTLALAVYQCYNFSAEWIIISDSVAYAPIFGIDVAEARTYRERLRAYRQMLNMTSTVHILDLDDMTTRVDAFQETYHEIYQKLATLLKGGAIAERFPVLLRGMRWNMNTRRYLDQGRCKWDDLWKTLDAQTAKTTELWQEINSNSAEIGLRYAAHNLTMKYLNLIRRFFPDAVRATVHPKPGQIAIPQLGEDSPWNGTAFLSDRNLNHKSIQTLQLHKILRTGPVTPVFLPGAEAPFFFM